MKKMANKTFQPTGDKAGLVFSLGVIALAAERPRSESINNGKWRQYG
jgi:hypothetical protein